MIIRTVTTLALHCPHCGTTQLHDISLFEVNKKILKLVCSCGQMQANVTRAQRGQYLLDIPCVICDTNHILYIDSKRFWCVKLEKLYCTQENLEIGFIGERQAVEQKIATFKHEFDSLVKEMDYEEYIENPPVMMEVLNTVHDLAAKGRICCSCGSNAVEVEVLTGSIELSCACCGGTKIIPAHSENDLRQIKKVHALDILSKCMFHR